MHPVLQSVRNASVSAGGPHQQQPQQQQHGVSSVRRPPSPPRYPAQHAYPGAGATPTAGRGDFDGALDPDEGPVACGLAAGAGVDEVRMRERDAARRATVPEINLFKARRDVVPNGDYERDLMYHSGQAIDIDRQRVLTPEDFKGSEPAFTPAVNHMRAAELKRAAEQTAFGEELRNTCHQTRIRTALLRSEIGAGIYYLYDFVQTYLEHPDGRVKLNPQLVLVAQHAGNTMLAQRLWAIAEEKNAWLRDLIEMAYMIVNDPYLNTEQQLSAICTTVVELSMKYAKLAAKNGYPSMAQMAKAQEFFYRVMQAVLDLGVQVGVYNNRPARYRQKRMSEIPQMTDAEYMFGLTQALESRPPQGESFADEGPSESDDEDDFI
ncbi:52K [Fowl aviadenovirus A]|nr:52K [Fowl aviadenovirus A]WNM87358.1 52K [Fowl aviadenovirus A]WNM87436.1 52K [Fowl aviadenovirus A]WNM87826.1 52K [Fowl aviadenovirus A]WNM87943.1 52K [Fowl aviadenovirus A]